MKQLLIMRHAKSSWGDPAVEDFDRNLNERGKEDAPEMGKRILKKGFKPDLIVSSPARRALKTAKDVARELGYDEKNIEQHFAIYEAAIEDVIHVIRNLEDQYERVIIVGHNPAFTGLVGYLGDALIENMPTAGAALLELNIKTWKQCAQQCGKILWFDFPKNKVVE